MFDWGFWGGGWYGGEGVDIPIWDAEYIHSGYNTPHRVVQAVGRPLRLYEGKDLARVYLHQGTGQRKKVKALKVYDPLVEQKITWVDL